MESEIQSKPAVALLQRAIPHYRFPLFKKLAEDPRFKWIFYCAEHDQEISTGLPSPRLRELDIRPIRNQRLSGPFFYQTGVKLYSDQLAAFMCDLGWTLISTPRYLIEARLRGIATIGWSKGIPQTRNARESAMKRLHQKFMLSLCDVLVVYGETSREYFRALGFPEERIFIAQNTIDTLRIASELPSALAQKEILLTRLAFGDRFVFGYVGGLLPRKKIECILEAFSKVRGQGMDAILLIVGGGPSEAALRAAAASSPFKADIIIVGRVPEGEEGGYFQLFDAYLSFSEGGLGILEAMAHGRTVVSAPEKFPETELLVDNETALLARDGTITAFSERMCFAVEHRDKLGAIGARARERVLNEATLDKMVEAITSAVQAAITRRRRA